MTLTKAHIAVFTSAGDFLPTFVSLTRQLAIDNGLALVQEFNAYLLATTADMGHEPSPALSVAIVITLLHLTLGSPLYFTDELMLAWNAAGTTSGGVECARCAYRQLAAGPCVACGGRTGKPGCFAEVRRAKALSN